MLFLLRRKFGVNAPLFFIPICLFPLTKFRISFHLICHNRLHPPSLVMGSIRVLVLSVLRDMCPEVPVLTLEGL